MITLEQAARIYEKAARKLDENIRIFAYAETKDAFFFQELSLSLNYQENIWLADRLPCVKKEDGSIGDEENVPYSNEYKCLPGAEELYAKNQLRKRAELAIREELAQLDEETYAAEVEKISTFPAYEAAILKKMQELASA